MTENSEKYGIIIKSLAECSQSRDLIMDIHNWKREGVSNAMTESKYRWLPDTYLVTSDCFYRSVVLVVELYTIMTLH